MSTENTDFKFFKRDGYSFKIKCWLTANEMREIQMAPYNGLEFSKEELEKTIQGELIVKMENNTQNKTIEKYVIEFNENKENILSRILNSNSEILVDIEKSIKDLTENEEKVKKNSSTTINDSIE